MPVSGAAVTGRLESAVTFTLTRMAYARIMHQHNSSSILLFCCALSYMLLLCLDRVAQHRVFRNMLGRGSIIVLGVVALELTRELQFHAIDSESTATGSTVARLICLTSMLVFVSVLLDGVSMQYNFVGVFLYIFTDAIQSLLHVKGSGMLTLLLAFVTCSCTSAASAVLRALLPGLEVLMQAATTANVNLALAVVEANCPVPLAHICMLLLLMHVLEICKVVRSDLADTQAYAAYRISALLFGYILSSNTDVAMLTMLVAGGLLVLRNLSVSPVFDQLLYLVCINASVHLTNVAMGYVHGELAMLTMLCLIVSFETVKMLFE
jgi:uncharacterized protein YhhL (DUF1145 family)